MSAFSRYSREMLAETSVTTMFSPEKLPKSDVWFYCHTCLHSSFICKNKQPVFLSGISCKICTMRKQALNHSITTHTENFFNRVKGWLYSGKPGSSLIGKYLDVPAKAEKHVSLIEDVFFLMHSLMISSSAMHRVIALASFMKARGNSLNVSSMTLAVLSGIVNNLFTEEDDVATSDPLFADICERVDWHHQSTLSDLRRLLDGYKAIKDSPLFKKVHKFALYVLSLGLLDNFNVSFNSLGFSNYETKMIKQTHRPGFDMLHCILDTILFVCERGSEYLATGDVSTLLSNGKGFGDWFAEAQLLIQQSHFLSNPKPHGFDRFSFVARLKDSIERGTAIMKFATGEDGFEKASVIKTLYQLKMIEAVELTKRAAQAPRKDPMSLLVHGSSSNCKSQFKQIVFYHYGKIFNLPTDPEYMYTRCPTDEYWSGFDSTQWCIVQDDIAFLKPNGEIDPTLKEMLQIKNSVPYTPPQAALEDKGKTPVLAELLIGTTNTKSLNLNAYFACPFAIARRFQYVVTIAVKPEYSKHSIMADSSKIPITPEGEYMNIWDITISEPEPEVKQHIDSQQTRYVVKQVFSDINDFLEWFITVSKQHEESQRKAMAADNTMSAVSVCATCYRATSACKCIIPGWLEQADPEEEVVEEVSMTPPTILSEDPFVDTSEYSLRMRVQLWVLEKILTSHYISLPDFAIFGEEVWQRWVTLVFFWLLWPFTAGFAYTFFLFLVTSFAIVYSTVPYFWIIVAKYYQMKYGYHWKLRLCFWLLPKDLETTQFLIMVLGRKINKKRALTVAGVVMSVLVLAFSCKQLWNLFSKLKFQGGVQSIPVKEVVKKEPVTVVPMVSGGNTPVPLSEEKPTFYYHDPYMNTSIEISDASRCIKPFGVEQKLRNATAYVTLHYPGRKVNTCAVNIKGQIWIINAHSLSDGPCTMDLVLEPVTQNVSRNISGIKMAETNFRIIEGTDIAFFETKACPPGKDLSMYLPTNNVIKGRYAASLLVKTASGISEKIEVRNVQMGKCPVGDYPGFVGIAEKVTANGMCGSAYLAEIANGAVILGIHTAGNDYVRGVFCSIVTKQMLDTVLKTFDQQANATTVQLSLPGYEREILPVAERASVRWIEQGTATVLGSISGFRAKPKSKVKSTYIREAVKQDGYIDECQAPDVSKKAWFKNVNEMVKPNYKFCPKLLRECVNAFTADILKGVGDQIKMVEPYTQEVALNGVDGVTYVDKMNFATSAGAPFRKSKKFFVDFTSDNKAQQLAEVVQTEIGVILNLYDKGDLYHPVYTGTLKDEPTPKRKVLNAKTRLFACSTFPHSVVTRMSYLSIIRLIQNNPFVFEAMPGIVAQSDEWKRLFKHIVKHGLDKIIAGDFAFFDKHMIALLIMEAFQICINLMEASGNYDEVQLLRAKMIAFDIAYPTMDIDGLLMMIQQNPSGHPLTVIINCLVNSLYMRYVFVLITGKTPDQFQKYVSLATYGDDNIMGVSDEIPEFNHTSIAEALATVGVKYTMAEKDAESVPYIHIKDASFLKRKFVYDPDSHTVMAPLDHSSFNKMLTSYTDNGVLAPEAHSIAVIETALREYWFYGAEVFENRRAYFMMLINKLNLQDWVRESTFPTWAELLLAHEERSRHVHRVELSVDECQQIMQDKPDFMFDLRHGF